MIVAVTFCDADGLARLEGAGDPDMAVVARAVGLSRRPQADPDLRRYYYVGRDNPRVRLVVVGQPLPIMAQAGGLKCVVGSARILGEFALQRPHIGQLGLSVKVEPLAWLSGHPDQTFATLSDFLDSLLL